MRKQPGIEPGRLSDVDPTSVRQTDGSDGHLARRALTGRLAGGFSVTPWHSSSLSIQLGVDDQVEIVAGDGDRRQQDRRLIACRSRS